MALINLISGAMVTMGAALMLIGVIGLVLTRGEERKNAHGAGAPTPLQSPAVTASPQGEALGRTIEKGDRS